MNDRDCQFQSDGPNADGKYDCVCSLCGFEITARNPPDRVHRACDNPPDLAPLLTRLAELTNHPEIIDQPKVYGRPVQIWAAGIPDQCKPFETRDDEEVEFIETICRANVCKKCKDGVCRPSCGPGMLVIVKARMASESCPWAGSRW